MLPAPSSAHGASTAPLQHGGFDYALPLGKRLLTTREAAQGIGRGIDYVRELVDSARLEAHQDSAFGSRKSSTVTRRSVLLYLAQTATLAPEGIESALAALVDELDRRQLVAVLRRVEACLAKVS